MTLTYLKPYSIRIQMIQGHSHVCSLVDSNHSRVVKGESIIGHTIIPIVYGITGDPRGIGTGQEGDVVMAAVLR